VTAVGDPVGASKSIRLELEVNDRAVEDVLILLEPSGTKLLAGDEPEARHDRTVAALGIGLSLAFELVLWPVAPGATATWP